MSISESRPSIVSDAMERASLNGFMLSCRPVVGRLLATLAAAVPMRGRILELGTGVGVGTSWLVHGLRGRQDVDLVTVESSVSTAALAQNYSWPRYVNIRVNDAEQEILTLGQFDLIFADAEGGKWSGLDLTLDALKPGGVLIVDDMDIGRYQRDEHRKTVSTVRETLLTDPRLIAVDISAEGGIMMATRLREAAV